MSTAFLILAIVFLLATLGALAGGVVTMARGDAGSIEGNLRGARRSNRFMRMRIGFQAAALTFFILALLTSG